MKRQLCGIAIAHGIFYIGALILLLGDAGILIE